MTLPRVNGVTLPKKVPRFGANSEEPLRSGLPLIKVFIQGRGNPRKFAHNLVIVRGLLHSWWVASLMQAGPDRQTLRNFRGAFEKW